MGEECEGVDIVKNSLTFLDDLFDFAFRKPLYPYIDGPVGVTSYMLSMSLTRIVGTDENFTSTNVPITFVTLTTGHRGVVFSHPMNPYAKKKQTIFSKRRVREIEVSRIVTLAAITSNSTGNNSIMRT